RRADSSAAAVRARWHRSCPRVSRSCRLLVCYACSCLAVVRCDDPHQAAVEFFRVGYVQELVGPVCVGVWTKHARDQKLGLWEALAQHGHEGNRTAKAEITGLLAKELLGTGVRHLGQPWRQWRGTPTSRTTCCHGDAGAKRRLCLED